MIKQRLSGGQATAEAYAKQQPGNGQATAKQQLSNGWAMAKPRLSNGQATAKQRPSSGQASLQAKLTKLSLIYSTPAVCPGVQG